MKFLYNATESENVANSIRHLGEKVWDI